MNKIPTKYYLLHQHTRRILSYAPLLLLLVGLVGCNLFPVTGFDDGQKTLTSEKFAFSIDYPVGWIGDELPKGNHGDKEIVALISVPGRSFPAVVIQRKEMEAPSLKDVAAWGKQRIVNRYHERELGELESAELNSESILTRTYDSNMTSGSNIRSKDIYIAHKDEAIIITLRSTASQFAEDLPTFEAIVDSFTLLEQVDKYRCHSAIIPAIVRRS